MSTKLREIIERTRPWACGLYLFLGLLVLGPGLAPGNLFLLDMTWPDRMRFDSFVASRIDSSTPLNFMLWALGQVVPSSLLQKAVLVLTITACGYGAYRLSLLISRSKKVAFVSGAISCLNPYVLSRLAAGQWQVVAGYAYLLFLLVAIIKLSRKFTKKRLLVAAAMWLAYPLLSIHWWYMTTLFLLPMFTYRIIILAKNRASASAIKNSLAYVGLLVVGIVLVGVLGRIFGTQIHGFGSQDFVAFSTGSGGQFGALGSVLTLRGFWFSDGGLPVAANLIWMLLCGVSLIATGYCFWVIYAKNKLLGTYLTLTLVVIIILAVGYSNTYTARLIDLLRSAIPGFEGLRDTQKFVGFIALTYSLCVPYAAVQIYGHRKNLGVFLGTFMTLMYMITASVMIPINYADFRVSHYPESWKILRQKMSDKKLKKTLVLPWESYVHLPFAGNNLVANPAEYYFGNQVHTRRGSTNRLLDQKASTASIDSQILSLKRSSAALKYIAGQGYDSLMLLNVEDTESYRQVLDDHGLQKTYQDKDISLYRLLD